MGKTTKLISWAMGDAAMGYPVGIASLEMSSRELSYRFLSNQSGVANDKLMSGQLDDRDMKQLSQSSGQLEQLPIYIDSTPAMSTLRLKSIFRRMIKEHGIKIAFVDYAQICGKADRKADSYHHVSEVAQSMKGIAKELDIPVVLFSQLNRSVENRGGMKKPQLADLRESGALEENADQVMFLYRGEYYNLAEDEEGNDLTDLTEIIIGKNRHGALQTLQEKHDLSTSTYTPVQDLEPSGPAPEPAPGPNNVPF
jgi:replicative DNA helicase